MTLPHSMVATLRAHRQRQVADRLRAGPDWEDLGLIFATPSDRTPNSISERSFVVTS